MNRESQVLLGKMGRVATKTFRLQIPWLVVLFVSLLSSAAYSQITPSGDSYTNTADSSTNYGSKTLLDVDGASQITYIQFNLASIPSTASISQATLKLYVNSVTTAGSFNVDYVNGTWSESKIDASNAPPPGTTIAPNVNVTTADKNQYVLVNVTTAVRAWLDGSETNNGFALVANSSFNATFDSKENTTTSHPPELDIAYAGGDGTITGVTTASGSGLTGGGTSGTLNLSLTNACSSGQILQWNGSAWVCIAAKGTGTITGVTAGTGLSGGGSSGNVTLNNTGLLGLTAGTGIAVGSGQTPTVSVSGVPLLLGNNLFGGSDTFAGAVGIGTSSGTSSLTVGGSSNDGQVEIVGPSSSEASMGFRSSNVGKGASGDWVIGTNTATSGAGGFSIEQPDQSAPFLVISPVDNVGIGTSGPGPGVSMTGGLAINGVGSTVLTTQYEGVNSFALNPDPVPNAGNGWTLWDFASGKSWAAGITQKNGLVGIGTYSPDNTLTVDGSADKPGGGSWGTYSDRRLKTLDGAFSAGLSQIMKINPVHYRYKQDNAMGIHDTSEHVGLVAQDVQKVIPEAVTENSKGYLLVNNDPIIWTMLNAIKEQQKLIHQQRVQVQLQQAKIDQLSRQVHAVQAALKASRRPNAEVQTASAIALVIHH
jgi:hypothetical protein